MRIQPPTIIVICLFVVMIVPMVYYMKTNEGGKVAANLESEEFKLMGQHAQQAFNAKNFKQSVQLYEDMLLMRPENAEIHNNLGATYYEYAKEYAGPSWPSWEADLAGKTTDEALAEFQLAVDQVESGYLVFKSDDPDVTNALYEEAKAKQAYIHVDKWENRATLNLLIGGTRTYFMKAQSSYIRAIDISPTYSPAYRNLGSLFMDIGQTDVAIDNLQKAYELDPRDKELEQYLDGYRAR